MAQRPRYITFYKPKETTPEVILTLQEAKQWLNEKNANLFTPNSRENQLNILSSKEMMSPILSLSISKKDQYPFVHMSPRRAGCK
jgi:hypothetical protein